MKQKNRHACPHQAYENKSNDLDATRALGGQYESDRMRVVTSCEMGRSGPSYGDLRPANLGTRSTAPWTGRSKGRARAWSRVAGATACLLIVASACGGTPATPEVGSATSAASPVDSESTTSDVSPSESPSGTTHSAATPTPAAELLIGAWSSTNPGDATFAYRFDQDGTYVWIGVITQPRAAGHFQLTVTATGRFTLEGNTILLEPIEATRTRNDPDDPQGDYVDQPYSLEPARFRWAVEADDALTLTDANGTQHLTREQ
jgi:hypothetical protein